MSPRKEGSRSVRVKSGPQRLWSDEQIRKELDQFIFYSGWTPEKSFPLTLLRKAPEFASLKSQLQLLSYFLSSTPEKPGTMSYGVALRHFGYATHTPLATTEIESNISTLITRPIAEKVYRGEWNKGEGILGLMLAGAGEDKEKQRVARQAYYACFSRGREDFKPDRLVSIVNKLYPDLKAVSGMSLTEALGTKISLGQIQEKLQDIYWKGGDLAEEGLLRTLGGDGFVYRLKSRGVPGVKKKASLEEKMPFYVGIPGLSAPDLVRDYHSSPQEMGYLSEKELLLSLEILRVLKVSPSQLGEEFRNYFPEVIEAVYPPNKNKVKVKGAKDQFADARVIMSSLEALVEVKNMKYFSVKDAELMVRKYSHVHHWDDDRVVSKKIALIHANGGVDPGAYKVLEQGGFTVMSGEVFSRFYESSLRLLEEKRPHFFSGAPLPVADIQTLIDLDHQARDSSHLLMRRGHRFERQWLNQVLVKDTIALRKETHSRKREIPALSEVQPFSAFQEEYHGRENIEYQDHIFIDIETADQLFVPEEERTSFRKKGEPFLITCIGMAYYDPSREEMVSEVLFARNPGEEVYCLKKFSERAKQYSNWINFNGSGFDFPRIRERMTHHLISPHFGENEIDMFHQFYRFHDIPSLKKGEKRPPRTLKSYERRELDLFREGDIPGDKAPQVYEEFMLGKHSLLIPGLIYHNQLDVVTLAIMYDQYKDKIRTKK